MKGVGKSTELMERTQKIGLTWGANIAQTWTAGMNSAANVVILIPSGSRFSTAMARPWTLMNTMTGIVISVCIIIFMESEKWKLMNTSEL
jgi:hypothetical protein